MINGQSIFRLLIILIITITHTSIAQSNFNIGAKAGINYVNNIEKYKDNTASNTNDFRLSYHLGVCANLKLSDNLSLSPKVLFTPMGFSNEGSSGKYNVHYNYIYVPINVNFHINEKIAFHLGPKFGYLLSARSKNNDNNIDLLELWNTFNKDYSRLDFALNLGIQYSLTDKIFVSADYSHGLSSVPSQEKLIGSSGNEGTVRFENRNIQLSVGYMF